MLSILQCIGCGKEYPIDSLTYTCEDCGALMDVWHDLETLRDTLDRDIFDQRLGTLDAPYNSGVWRYKEIIMPDIDPADVVSRPEGNTNLYNTPRLAEWAGVDKLMLKHEGENPTGSFKDRGMTGGVTQAKTLGMARVACASTGNTSASLASYAALAEKECVVFFQNTQIAMGKLSQAVAYGATAIQINADFDRNLELVREVAEKLDIYVLNSINPFRLEGQKSIIIEVIQQLKWHVPDWIVVPGGNLGNSSAFGKALYELYQLGFIEKIPRLAVIQAEGANPLYSTYRSHYCDFKPMHADTVATAIKIGNPVNLPKAVRTLLWTNGVVEQVSDQEIMDAKALIDAEGIGCEPASACSLAGTRKLVEQGVIHPEETVVGILTGHLLKDPDATINYHSAELDGIVPAYSNRLHQAEPNIEALTAIIEGREPAQV